MSIDCVNVIIEQIIQIIGYSHNIKRQWVFLQDGRCLSVNALASAGWQVQLASSEVITHSRVLGSQTDQRAESLLPHFIGREAEAHFSVINTNCVWSPWLGSLVGLGDLGL